VGYKLASENVDDLLPLVGSLEANEAVKLRSEVAGRVEQINFEEGADINKGDVIFRIDAEKLQAEVDEAQANFNLAKANRKRSMELLAKKTISIQEHEQTQANYAASKATLERVTNLFEQASIRAPFDGVVGERLVSPGEYVQQGDSLSSLVAMDPLKISFEVPEKYLDALSVKQEFQIKVAAYPSKEFKGHIYFIAPQVDRDTRTVLVKGETSNPERLLRPGMFANILLKLKTFENALLIPDSSIMMEKEKVFVYIVGEQDQVAIRPITIEKMLKGRVIVSSGLKSGDVIVAQGFQKLFPGAAVKLNRFLGQEDSLVAKGTT
jgi:membrane fusion protein (multidrug efflux system)